MLKSLSIKPLIGSLLSAILSLAGNLVPGYLGIKNTKQLTDFHDLTLGAAGLALILIILSVILGSRKAKKGDFDEDEGEDNSSPWGENGASNKLQSLTSQLEEEANPLSKAELKEKKKKEKEQEKFNKEAKADAAKAAKQKEKNSRKSKKKSDYDEDDSEESPNVGFSTFSGDFGKAPEQTPSQGSFPPVASTQGQGAGTPTEFDLSAYVDKKSTPAAGLDTTVDNSQFAQRPEYKTPTYDSDEADSWIDEAFDDKSLQYPHGEQDLPSVVMVPVEIDNPNHSHTPEQAQATDHVDDTHTHEDTSIMPTLDAPIFGLPTTDATQE